MVHRIRIEDMNNVRCSREWKSFERDANSKRYGKCQIEKERVNAVPETIGCIKNRNIFRKCGDLLAARSTSHPGTPSTKNKGDKYIKMLCWNMCALNRNPSPSASSGEPTAR